jgi:hypothetical protein
MQESVIYQYILQKGEQKETFWDDRFVGNRAAESFVYRGFGGFG